MIERIFARIAACACMLAVLVGAARADDSVRVETGVDRVIQEFGLTGQGVLIAILDRGIDYEHPDFRNADGTTRIVAIYDMTDDTGAGAPDNPYGIGTLYTRAQIDEALASGIRLATRDAVGHGTTTAGLAGGNGRASDGRYAGMAPNASFLIVKIVGGAPAHGDEPAEAPANVRNMEAAIDYAVQVAGREGMPLVALANIGSIGAVADGTTAWARAIDQRFGPGKPGRVFVTGTSDDGGMPNHAAGTVPAGETIDLLVHKGDPGTLRFELWHDGADRFGVEIVTPSGTFGPYDPPANNSQRTTEQTAEFTYYHNGSNVDFWDAASQKREILIDFAGMGDYVVRLAGSSILDGRFHATLNPSRIFEGANNRFESFVVPGYTVWDMASARNNIAPNSYVLRHAWTDIDGTEQVVDDEGEVGDLWIGSGIGPTYDERLGVSFSAPGERLIAPYAPRSFYATGRSNIVMDDGEGGMYGIQSAVSAAAPVTTGIIALLLEANPVLDAEQVRNLLQRTARADAFTGDVPNSRWGYGKIDAYAAAADLLGATSIERIDATPAGAAALLPNYPNPFADRTRIRFQLPAPAHARLTVYDLLGREVAVLFDRAVGAGIHEATFEADGMPSGLYLYRLEAGTAVLSRTMVRMR